MAVLKAGIAHHGTTPAQQHKAHSNFISLLTDLLDCKKAMLVDSERPGELPLMKELSSLKRVQSLRDPSMGSNFVAASSSARTPSWKFPIAKTRETRYDQPNVNRSRNIRVDQLSVSTARRTCLRRGGLHHTAAASFPDPLWAIERERAWDLGMAAEESSVCVRARRQPVLRQRTPIDLSNDQFSLRNWGGPSWASDMEASHSTSFSRRKARLMSRINGSGDPMAGGRSEVHSRNAYEPPQTRQMSHDVVHRFKRTLARYQHATSSGSKQQPQILSPLVLNSRDEAQYHSNSFALEGKHYERRNQPIRGARQGVRSPQYSNHMARKGQRQAIKSKWKAQYTTASSTSSSQWTTSQSSMSGAWEAASNQLKHELDVCELPKHGCGIPCYWSKCQRRGNSLLDMAERSFACGLYSRSLKRSIHPCSGSCSCGSQDEPSPYPGTPARSTPDLEALPLLSDSSACSGDIVGSSVDDSDELNGELNLHGGEGGRGHSSDVQDSGSDGKELAIYSGRPRSLSQKYRPKAFEELIGQNLVAQTLSNAVRKRKVAPVYLFQGSRGTGKTSAARIFAAALNCGATEEEKPCGICKNCLALAAGKSLDIKEVDAASNNALEKVKALLQSAFSARSLSQYRVFIIDECHMLTNETWSALLTLLERPPRNTVFILITTNPGRLPTIAVSRCQSLPFPKIKDAEIIKRLQALAECENLKVEQGALDLVAARADGSLRDAEIILDQLSLLGQEITVSTVHDLFGSVSDEKLVELLDFALSSDTVNTVQRARELFESGVEPLDLMVQLATLITGILAGSNDAIARSHSGGFFANRALSEKDLERLQCALQILSSAEQQLRASSNDRTTWLTAALLQLGPARSFPVVISTSGTSAASSPVVKASSNGTSRQVLKVINGKTLHESTGMGGSQKKSYPLTAIKNKNRFFQSSSEVQLHSEEALNVSNAASKEPAQVRMTGNSMARPNRKRSTLVGAGNLESLWHNVLESCKLYAIRQLLRIHGKLLAVSISTDGAVVFLEFDTDDAKSKAERCKRNIANSFGASLDLTVEVKIALASDAITATSKGARVQATVDQQAFDPLQNNSERSSGMAMPQLQVQNCAEIGSLHHWRSQSQVASPRVNSTRSFPAILTISRNNKVGDSDHMMRSLNSTPHFGSGVKTVQKAEFSTFEGTRVGGSRNAMSRITLTLQRCQSRRSIQEIVSDHGSDNLKAELASPVVDAARQAQKNGFSYDLEEENLRLESQSKYGGLLCWRGSKAEEDMDSNHSQKRCTILKRLVPCAN